MAAVFALPGGDGDLTLESYVSDKQIGCMLIQYQPDGAKKPEG